MFSQYSPKELEPAILKYWQEQKVNEKRRKKNLDGPKFYFLEGPPYTSGRVHIGTAWQTSMKDIVLRYKRMQQFNVWDRMGYDMHGLPTEQKVMAKLNLKNKEEIERYGLKKFTDECEKFCSEMMQKMNEDFIRLGISMDFTDPYQPIKKEFMEGEWWLIKKAHEKGRLYQGLRTMQWDAATQTAVAKHEVEYKTIKDTSIYVKFLHQKKPNVYFIIWTTTPWTIPLNLAIMVNPDLTYVEVEVEIKEGNQKENNKENKKENQKENKKETWIVAKELLENVMKKAKIEKFKIKKEYPGKELESQKYHHPLNIQEYLPKELQKNQKLFSILLSSEHVDTSAGTGLVHCAPGCGPEDYEVGHLNHLPPFNCVNEEGFFENFGEFTKWKAKTDDHKFIKAIDNASALIAKESYEHEYPHGERSHEPVIFRTTKQWFFKVEDLKEKMLKANESILWNPAAAKNGFNAWLENLRDNSITKQRYWGTPVPIWQAPDGDYIVVGSITELEELSGKPVKNMHIPDIDKITITKNGKIYKRVPDVLDVWIDAGTASWNCLDYPKNKELLEKFFPADFILEGKDQIRGWFNLLMVASFLAFERPSFKNVYMNGFVTDINGVKMSKSLGNIISPDELIQKYSADVLRYYMFQTNAGEDVNFSWEECELKSRNLLILWNLHKLLINLSHENEVNPFELNPKVMHNLMSVEEEFILSKLNSNIKKVTQLLEEYRLDEIITPIEDLYLELSRTYIQMIRDKSTLGSEEEKQVCTYTIAKVLFETIKMFHLICPFITEAIFLNLKEKFQLKEISLSHYDWSISEEKRINKKLEQEMEIGKNIMQSILGAREKAKLGVRWPVKEVVIITKNEEVIEAVGKLLDIIQKQTNLKLIRVLEQLPGMKIKVKPDFGKIGAKYGPLTPSIITTLTIDSPQTIINHIEKEGAHKFTVEGKEVSIGYDMIIIEREIPNGYQEAEYKNGFIYLNLERNPELEAEGYAREMTRNLQQMRKTAGLQKQDLIILFIKVNDTMKKMLEKYKEEVADKISAREIEIVSVNPIKNYELTTEFTIKNEKFHVWFEKIV